MHGVSKKMDIHNHWANAIVVYPQGMWGEGRYYEGFGWVIPDGEDEGRDIRFFDVLLDYMLKNYNVDSCNIYAAGHSNGSAFTHAFWAFRGDKFRGFMASSSSSAKLKSNAAKRVPKPVFIIGGIEDELVKQKVLDFMNPGTTGDVISIDDEWVLLKYKDIEGYVYKEYWNITEKN